MTYAARSLKVAVLREEFVALTGDAFQAIVLNQFIYWVQKVNDFDDFIREEQERNPDCNVSLRHGWIYKKAQDLIDETMLQMSENTMRRILKTLIEKGWVEERTNPDNRWNKVLQYRPDLKKIQQDLYHLGYALPGFPLLQPAENSNRHFDASKRQFEGSKRQTERFEASAMKVHIKDSKITPEIIAEKSTDTREDFSKSMLEIWNRLLCPPIPVQMTAERLAGLKALLAEHFENKLALWEPFCQEITRSSFLMGKGQRGWKATLDWVLIPANLQKILEGNYRDSEASPPSPVTEKPSSQDLKLKVEQHLEGLPHPLSRQFCRRLLRHVPPQKFLSWFGEAEFSGWEEGQLTLSFPYRPTRDYVERHFSSEIGSAARSVSPHLKNLTLTVRASHQRASRQESPMDSSLLTRNAASSKNQKPHSPHGCSSGHADPAKTFSAAVQTTEPSATPRTLQPSPCVENPGLALPSSREWLTAEHKNFSLQDNRDFREDSTEDHEKTLHNPCFSAEEESVKQGGSLLSLQRSCDQDDNTLPVMAQDAPDSDCPHPVFSFRLLEPLTEDSSSPDRVQTLFRHGLPPSSSSPPLTERTFS